MVFRTAIAQRRSQPWRWGSYTRTCKTNQTVSLAHLISSVLRIDTNHYIAIVNAIKVTHQSSEVVHSICSRCSASRPLVDQRSLPGPPVGLEEEDRQSSQAFADHSFAMNVGVNRYSCPSHCEACCCVLISLRFCTMR